MRSDPVFRVSRLDRELCQSWRDYRAGDGRASRAASSVRISMITTMGKRGPTPAPRGHSPIAPRAPGSNQQRGTGADYWASSTAVVAVTDVRAIWDELAPDLQRRGYSRRGTPRPSARAAMPPPVALSSIWRSRARLWSKPSWSSCAHLGHRGRLVGWSAACRCGWRVTRRTPALRDQDVDAHELCSNETNKRNEGNYESVAT